MINGHNMTNAGRTNNPKTADPGREVRLDPGTDPFMQVTSTQGHEMLVRARLPKLTEKLKLRLVV